MRIQHNIMAMNAYRNYTNNVSAMKKNLEKLSSGYKINRAGDDAAGLAISEKMRAQITGLETAQKNAKDGISLVQTAEGALTEVHDMLNRMVTLATQSANGTYDNETDRVQLQKELDQLRTEINRIADSSNFNGIKLLDGSLDGANAASASSPISAITTTPYSAQGASDAFKATYVTNRPEAATTVQYAEFTVSLDDVKITKNSDGAANNYHTFTLKVGDAEIKADGTSTGKLAGNADANAGDIIDALIQNGKSITQADGTGTGSQGDAALGTTAGAFVSIDGNIYQMTKVGSGATAEIKFTQYNKPANGAYISPDYETSFSATPAGTAGKGGGVTGTINDHVQKTADGIGIGASHQAQVDVDIDFTKLKDGDKFTAGGMTYVFKIGKDSTTAASGSDKLIDLSTILKTDEDITDQDKLKSAMTKITQTIDGSTNTNPTWTCGNFGVKGTTGSISFQSKSSYVDDSTAIGGSSATGAPKCNMTTEANIMKQFYGESKQIDASVSFNVDVTKIQKGQQFTINGQKFEFTDSAVAKDDEAVAINLSTVGDIDGNKLLASQSADVMNIIKTAVQNELGASAYTVTFDGDKLTILSKDLANTAKIKENKIAAEVSIPGAGGGLSLQIGDTAEDFNQIKVDVGDCHTTALGIADISIADQDSAKAAIDSIKSAVNYVSDVRGTLGATQNRLDHTINNLSVMTENIQDAESTIRDTDVAAEMMAYTKNNILIQSAQAMLAQANQVPQGVLQLLQ